MIEPEQHRPDVGSSPSPSDGPADSAAGPQPEDLPPEPESTQTERPAEDPGAIAEDASALAPEASEAAVWADPLVVDIEVELEYSDRVNFAMQQHGVPLVDAVLVTSRETEPVEGVSVTLGLENGEAQAWTGRIGPHHHLPPVPLRPGRLARDAGTGAPGRVAGRAPGLGGRRGGHLGRRDGDPSVVRGMR